MNFLALCQEVARDSGTISGALPTTVLAQTEKLGKIVDWTNRAYNDIQVAHRGWRWLQGEFYGDITSGVSRYAYGNFSDFITAAAITRFSQWGFKRDGSDVGLTMYLTATGVAAEGALRFMEWDRFYESQLRGTQTPGPPNVFSITPDDKLIFSPVPDATYTVRGRYRKSAQDLTTTPSAVTPDTNTPEMPTEFHHIIAEAAHIYLEGYDEGPGIPLIRLRMLPKFSMLEMHQLPRLTWGPPLA